MPGLRGDAAQAGDTKWYTPYASNGVARETTEEDGQLYLPLTVTTKGLSISRLPSLVMQHGFGVEVELEVFCPQCEGQWMEDVMLWDTRKHNDSVLEYLTMDCSRCYAAFDEVRAIHQIAQWSKIPETVLWPRPRGGPF